MPLLTGPRILNTTAAIQPLRAGSRWLRTEWILSRALCRYRILDFTDVPRSKRSAALRLQLSQFAPFAEPGYAVAWEGVKAQVWCWDAQKLREAGRDAELPASRIRVVPESLCHAPLSDGPRLLTVTEGYEGQVWKDRALIRSRFWSTLPDDADWIAFQRDAGLLPEAQEPHPAAVESALLAQPYAKVGEGLSGGSPLAFAEPVMLFVLVAALGTASAWYLTRTWKYAARGEQLTAEMKALETRAAPVLAARGRAIDNDVFANRLTRLATYPDPLSLMAAFATAFGNDNVILRDWNFNLGKLRAVIAYPNALPPNARVVAALQEQAPFANVRVAPGNEPKSLVISAEIRPLFKDDREQPRP
jgi:hypothetical protein